MSSMSKLPMLDGAAEDESQERERERCRLMYKTIIWQRSEPTVSIGLSIVAGVGLMCPLLRYIVADLYVI